MIIYLKLHEELIKKGYSDYSACILVSQYAQDPNNQKMWGTEEQTQRDIEKILRGIR